MKDFVNVGLLGAGTVGGGVLKVLEKNAEKIAKEVGKPVRITKVLDRHVDRLKQEYGDKYIFTDNADEVLELLLRTKELLTQTLIIVTHDMKIAERADRIMKMDNGRLTPLRVNY